MKQFIQFLEERLSKKINFLSWPSSFQEIKELHLKEDLEHLTNNPKLDIDEIHTHSDIIPNNLSTTEEKSLLYYTSMRPSNKDGHQCSYNMNNYLRNCAGDKSCKILYGHKKEKVKDAIEKLSVVFSSNNTNRVPITVYGAAPKHIIKKIQNGSYHNLAGFTSTTSKLGVAKDFARMYHPLDNDMHVLVYHMPQNVAISVANIADHGNENEFILNHGHGISYSHSEDPIQTPNGTLYLHHVNIHPERHTLENYGEYTD
jgi:hypothetical protein